MSFPAAIPAKAGIHVSTSELVEKWIPACAGMTTLIGVVQ